MDIPVAPTRPSVAGRRARHRRTTNVRYTLLAPPSRLTLEEAAALLHLPRRVVAAELEWQLPAASDVTDGLHAQERPALYA